MTLGCICFLIIFCGSLISLAPPSSMRVQSFQLIWDSFVTAIEENNRADLEQLMSAYKGKFFEDLKKVDPKLIAQLSKENVSFLVHNDYDLEYRDPWGETALHHACQRGDLNAIKNLVECGACLDARTSRCDGKSGFHFAAENGDLSIVQYFLKQGYDINSEDNFGRTALHCASVMGKRSLSTIKYLIAEGIDIQKQDQREMTALHYASLNGNVDVVEHLIRCGINIKCQNFLEETASS